MGSRAFTRRTDWNFFEKVIGEVIGDLSVQKCTHTVLCAGYNIKEAIHIRSLQSKLTGTKLQETAYGWLSNNINSITYCLLYIMSLSKLVVVSKREWTCW